MWLKESNRQKHLLYGLVVYLGATALLWLLGCPLNLATIAGFVALVPTALALEFKDNEYHNKFDWLDVVATILIPSLITFTIWIVYLLQ